MKERTKVYLYTRVSTAMQIDGYSLEAQKNRMKAYAEFNDYEIVGEYEDAGKSGKSIEGRIEFNRMMDDIKCSKDHVSYVLVFKLSRFGRNAADVLSTLQVMQDFGVNLICVEDGIDSSKDAGKLMISVLSAVAEIERENIRIQTMEGRIQKAREGKWNGGFAPYGYDLINGELHINEEEAKTVRLIYELYVHKKMGGRLIAQYLESHDIKKLSHKNTRGDMFAAAYIQDILRNPTYCGKIAYGRRKQEKVHGTRNDYRIVWNDDYLLTDGIHQPIVSVEDWEEAQARLRSQATKYKRYDRQENEHAYLLTGIIKCPECGAGMYVSKSVKKRPDGSYYKEFRYYGCKHRRMDKGQKCTFKNQLPMELMDQAVAEVIVSLVSRPDFAAMMAEKINAEIDISALLEEIAHYEKQLRQQYAVKDRLAEDIDQLDPDDRHYQRRKSDLEERLYKMYDKIEETEEHLIEARAKKQAIDADRITRDNILSILMNFEKLYSVMSDIEKRDLMATMIADIQVYPQRQPNGQWLKSIHFKLPLIAEEELQFSLDKNDWLERDCHGAACHRPDCDHHPVRKREEIRQRLRKEEENHESDGCCYPSKSDSQGQPGHEGDWAGAAVYGADCDGAVYADSVCVDAFLLLEAGSGSLPVPHPLDSGNVPLGKLPSYLGTRVAADVLQEHGDYRAGSDVPADADVLFRGICVCKAAL